RRAPLTQITDARPETGHALRAAACALCACDALFRRARHRPPPPRPLIRPHWPVYSLGAIAAALLLPVLARAQDTLRVTSPAGRNAVTVGVREGVAYYAVDRAGKHV